MAIYNTNIPILYIDSGNSEYSGPILEKISDAKPLKLYISGELDHLNDITTHFNWDCKVKTFVPKGSKSGNIIYKAVTWFFEHESEGIIIAGPNIPTPDFFGFCSELLEKYRDNDRVGHISSGWYLNKGSETSKYNHETYRFSNLVHFSCWATWRRVWNDIEPAIATYPTFKEADCLNKIAAFKPFKSEWYNNFDLMLKDEREGWAWQIKYTYSNLVNNRLSVIPNENLTFTLNTYKETVLDDITHPPIVICDAITDLKSQEVEFLIPVTINNEPDGYSFLKEKLLNIASHGPEEFKIPKIIHQIYEDPAGPPDYLKEVAKSWKEVNPKWEYRFWNKKEMDDFLEMHFPEFIPTYKAYQFNVQRWDAIRYLILYKYGGLYVDMDYECIEPMDILLSGSACCMGMEPTISPVRYDKNLIVGNAFMASVPEHRYFKLMIEDMMKTGNKELSSHTASQIIETTGPFLTTRVYEKYDNKEEITLLSADLVAPLTGEEVKKMLNGKETPEITQKVERAFAIHYFLGSWLPQTHKPVKK